MDKILRPNWVEINLNSLEKNLIKIRKIIKNKKITFVVKANAYGHGIIEVSKFAQKKKLCDYLGVSSIEEGIILRENGIKIPILVLGGIYPFSNFKYLYHYNLTPTISSLVAMDELIKYSKKINLPINVHLKLETGMNRIGAGENSMLKMVDRIQNNKLVKLEGIYSHLSSADTDKDYTLNQIKLYNEAVSKIKGINFIRHIANSFATVNFPSSHMDMVRCGLSAYGGMPGFEEVLSWKTRIVFIKYLKKGSYISYSKTFKTNRKTKVATIPLGYGDGYLRALSNKADVIINGKKAKIIGNVTMDMCMVDVTDINSKVGDEVTVLGKSENERISALDLANKAETIAYEITTLITQRVPRVYLYKGKNK
ncbi:MAG: alanine racemase [Elusimicrobiota bacterium]